jgi:hypothetical protein
MIEKIIIKHTAPTAAGIIRNSSRNGENNMARHRTMMKLPDSTAMTSTKAINNRTRQIQKYISNSLVVPGGSICSDVI